MTSRPQTDAPSGASPEIEREVNRRRRPDELRRELLDTGARLFAERGYEATTYRQITASAGVSDSVLFRHFGSRDQLLIEAVVEPFAEFLNDFGRRWSELTEISATEEHPLRRAFVAELFARLREHRAPLRAMLTVLQSASGEHLMGEVGTRLDTVISRVREIGEQHDRERGRTTAGVELKARLVIGMVVTAAVLDDWFIPADAQGAVTELLTAAMAELALTGRPITVLVRPDPEAGVLPDRSLADSTSKPGQRRRPDAVRESIITAARTLFANPGYGTTTYRSIAEAAHTSESALFRHFGTKSALVQEAVFEPVVAAYTYHRERWTAPCEAAGTSDDPLRSYLLVELYRYFRGRRAQLRLLMGVAHDSAHVTLNRQIRDWFGEVRQGLAPDPADVAHQAHISSLMAMALAAATLDDWFLPHRPTLPTHLIETTLARIAEGRDNSKLGRSRRGDNAEALEKHKTHR